MKVESKRLAVIEMLKANKSPDLIKKALGVNRMFIWRCQKRLNDTGGADRRPGSGRPRSSRTKNLIKAVSAKVRRNPARSMSKMAKEYDVSRRTISRVIKDDLGLHPYKLKRRQLLSEATKLKRLQRAKVLKSWYTDNPDVIVIFSDEKLFTVSRKFNPQNDRVLSQDIANVDPSIKYVYRTQKPSSIMIWCAVASNGKKSPVFRIPDGVKINKEVFLKFLQEKVMPWIRSEFSGKKICFTQDSAPAHGACVVQAWCQANFDHFWTKKMWPPSSPDLNPLDFAM